MQPTWIPITLDYYVGGSTSPPTKKTKQKEPNWTLKRKTKQKKLNVNSFLFIKNWNDSFFYFPLKRQRDLSKECPTGILCNVPSYRCLLREMRKSSWPESLASYRMIIRIHKKKLRNIRMLIKITKTKEWLLKIWTFYTKTHLKFQEGSKTKDLLQGGGCTYTSHRRQEGTVSHRWL